MRQGKVLAGFFAVALCIVFFCGVTASFGADKTVKPATSVEKVQTAPAKKMEQKQMMMKRPKMTCPGPDPAATIKVEIISRDEHGHGGRVRITAIAKNVGGADFTSGQGQQSVQLWEDVPGVNERQPVKTKEFQNLAKGAKIRISIERDWTASTEFPASYEARISYDPDILADGNDNNNDCNMNNNKKRTDGTKIGAMFTQ
ncbi:MAG: hypothetical protein JRJ47_10475 [Deltaproteobacteria bacterium]|nr:hypothetical protein [Deltaproteobacteria bacterium]